MASVASPTPRLRKNGKQQSCEPCRKSKLRCDHGSPHCGRCVRLGRQALCIFDPAPLTKVNGVRKPVFSPPVPLSPQKSLPTAPPTATQSSSPESTIESGKYNPLELKSGGDIGYRRKRRALPRLYHGITADSVIFDEAISHHLGHSTVERAVSEQDNIRAKPALLKFCCNVLAWLPTRSVAAKTMKRYTRISFFITFHLPTFLRFHEHFWEKYGDRLEHPRSPEALESIAEDFFNGTYNNPLGTPETNEELLQKLESRWEMLGLMFLAFGSWSFMTRDDDPQRLELTDGACGKSYGLSMLELADACLLLCEELDGEHNALTLSLMQRAVAFQSVYNSEGDLSLELWKRCGSLACAVTAQGAHCYTPPYKGCPLLVELTKRSFIVTYGFITSLSVFLGRPPLLSSKYCTTPAILDVSDEELISRTPSETLELVDEDGWNKQNMVYPATLCRTHYMSSFTYEEILELSLTKTRVDLSEDVLQEKVAGIRSRVESLWYKTPPILRSDINKELVNSLSQWEVCGIVFNRLSYFNRRFLLAKLDPIDHGRDYLYSAQEMIQVTLFLWKARDDFSEYHDDLKWFIAWCLIPSAAAVGVSLWKQVYGTSQMPSLNRVQVIQDLTLAIAALDWIGNTDGNYELATRAQRWLRHLVDGILAPPEPPPHLATLSSSTQDPFSFDFANMPDIPTFGVDMENWLLSGWASAGPMDIMSSMV